MRTTEYVLYPEWQGCGTSSAVYDGAASMAAGLFPETHFTVVDGPAAEHLTVRDQVLGLDSIARRFAHALDRLRDMAPQRIVLVGGTCGVEAAPVAYLNERYDGDLAVVWFDAHGDLNTPSSSPSGHFHGMVLRTLLGDGPADYVRHMTRPLAAKQIVLVGTRDLDPDEARFIRDAGITVIEPDAVADTAAVVAAIRARGFSRVYLHLDLDCFRHDEVPDTLMRTRGGPPFGAVAAAHAALRESFDPVGVSFVEFVDRGGGSLARLKPIADAIG